MREDHFVRLRETGEYEEFLENHSPLLRDDYPLSSGSWYFCAEREIKVVPLEKPDRGLRASISGSKIRWPVTRDIFGDEGGRKILDLVESR